MKNIFYGLILVSEMAIKKKASRMKLVITACASHLNANVSEIFETSPYFIFVDTEHEQDFKAIANPYLGLWSGADILCAQFIINQGIDAVLSGCCSANALRIFQAAHLKVFYGFNGAAAKGIAEINKGGLVSSDIR